jgi:tRNA C32,U32 (ribose-2'-O)-methylase TrmJ
MVYNIARSIIINLSLIKKLFMTQEEMTVLAKKVKEGVATKEEVFVFFKEFDRLLSEIKSVLEE